MKSFPSTLNESQNMYGSTKSQTYTETFDIERLKSGALNLNKSIPVVQEMLKDSNINISNYQAFPSMINLTNPGEISSGSSHPDKIYYENPLQLPADVIALAKDYEWVYQSRVKSILATGEKSGESLKSSAANTAVVPSMFNPMFGVNVLGITRNSPLLNDVDDDDPLDKDVSDCSIRTLCALSKAVNNPLGQARYKYADFMYCKDLGKVSNNHLITLRKFAHPVGDHIFTFATPKYIAGMDNSFQVEGDVGRLITWFGTDDNKLEDICKYSYHATWKELNAQIEEQDSKADDPTTGIVGMISNSLNPAYNAAVNAGQAGSHHLFAKLGAQVTNLTLQGIGKNNGLLRNYDNNKVYTPKNTIQSTNIYEGKLEFSQEFTLNFSYQLRAYDNINPRSAMLDLIGNILEVTYRRGKFWGGSRKIIGPTQSMSPFNKTSAYVDNAFEKLGGFFTSLMKGGLNIDNILGTLGGLAKGAVGALMNLAKGGTSEIASEMKSYIQKLSSGSGFSEAAKGYIKNALGRPSLYAWQSLLTGDDVGLWHVTIGNPRNPILTMGNLILTNATVQHLGPLGIDDFPTELKVSITLKHARPRDITEIGRMYTSGASAIYHHFAHHEVKDFFGADGAMVTKNMTPEEINKYNKNVDEINKARDQRNKDENLKGDNAYQHLDHINGGTKIDTEASYANDVKMYSGRAEGTASLDTLSDPFLYDSDSIKLARMNNYSSTMFYMSSQEIA